MRPLIIKDKYIAKNKISSFKDFVLEDSYLIKEENEGFKVEGKILLRGKLFYDLEEELVEKVIDVNILIPYEKLESRNMIKLVLDKAEFDKNDNVLLIKVKIKVVGEEEIKEKLIFRDERKMEFPPTESTSEEKVSLNEDFLNQIENIFDNEKVDVISTLDKENEEEKEDIFEVRMEEITPLPLIDEEISNEKPKEELLKSNYVTTFFFYRVKNNETLNEILSKYNMSVDDFKKLNNSLEVKENDLVQIKIK